MVDEFERFCYVEGLIGAFLGRFRRRGNVRGVLEESLVGRRCKTY